MPPLAICRWLIRYYTHTKANSSELDAKPVRKRSLWEFALVIHTEVVLHALTHDPSVLRRADVGGAWFVLLVYKNVKRGEGDKPADEESNSCLSKRLKRTWRSETKAVNQIWINPVLAVGRINHKMCFCFSVIQGIAQWHFKAIRSAIAEQFYLTLYQRT